MTYKERLTWVQEAPEEVLKDSLRHYSNRRVLWSHGKIILIHEDIEDMINFQRAILTVKGITSKQFLEYADKDLLPRKL